MANKQFNNIDELSDYLNARFASDGNKKARIIRVVKYIIAEFDGEPFDCMTQEEVDSIILICESIASKKTKA